MTLNDCTKAELLIVIDHLKRHLWPNGDNKLQIALNEVKLERETAKLNKADKIAEQASKKRQEYIDLLKPYEGKSFSEIPYPVISKARLAMVEAQKLDDELNRLMGIS